MKPQATMFGRMIRKYRIDLGVVLKDMSEAIGVSVAQVSAMELGKKSISSDVLEKLKDYFELDDVQFSKLQEVAALSQPNVKIDLKSDDDEERNMVVRFARNYKSLSPEKRQKLMEVLEGN